MSLEYCVNLLKKKEPKDGYINYVSTIKEKHNERMLEIITNDIEELPYEAFCKAYVKIMKKPGRKYEFFKRAGNSVKPALWNICQSVWKSEKFPASWNESTIIQIQKGKRFDGNLDNIRHIHDREETSKFFGQIVMECVKEPIFNNMSKFQIACRPGHRPSEHLFVVKSVINYYRNIKKGIIATSFDLKKFFDIENLEDCMNSLYQLNAKGKFID